MSGDRVTHGEGEADTHGYVGPHDSRTPRCQQGPEYRPRAAKEGLTDAGNGGRRSHAARGAETRVGGWRVTGVGDGQVGKAPRQERSWGVGV